MSRNTTMLLALLGGGALFFMLGKKSTPATQPVTLNPGGVEAQNKASIKPITFTAPPKAANGIQPMSIPGITYPATEGVGTGGN